MEQKFNRLFGSFPPVPTSDWEARIVEDLKGADYRKKLIWKTPEGFEVKPYYRAEDIQNIQFQDVTPGNYPFIRGNKTTSNGWEIRQDIESDVFATANRLALDALARGADSVGLNVSEVETESDLEELLKGICPTGAKVHFTGAASYTQLLHLLASFTKKHLLPARKLSGSLDFDPISYLLLEGDFWESEDADLAEIAEVLKLGAEYFPNLKAINVNGQYFGNAGSTLVQELAFSLASGNEYLCRATAAGLPVDETACRMMFTFSIASDYFMEIARLRAARLLWAKIVEQHHPAGEAAMKMHIHCTNSSWNKTLYDPYVNILRSTTEAMSAVIGGAQSVSVLPFDVLFRDPDEFSERIARNQQIILREEAYLDKVVDPAAGSYYIESLTQNIAEVAWKLFLEVEEMGGMIEAVKAGFVQDLIENSAETKINDVANRKIIQLGTNQYPNLKEEMLGLIAFAEDEEEMDDEAYADENDLPEEEEVTPYKKLVLFGGSDGFDEVRLATERFVSEGNSKPSVFLFNIGNLAMRKARAMFTTNFFGCAGYTILDNAGFSGVDEGVEAALASQAEIVVICSSDEEYATLGVEIAQKLKAAAENTILVVAGFPKEIVESLKEAGVDEFIHVRSNLLEMLEKFNEKLSIF